MAQKAVTNGYSLPYVGKHEDLDQSYENSKSPCGISIEDEDESVEWRHWICLSKAQELTHAAKVCRYLD
jgi:hypothetical protein